MSEVPADQSSEKSETSSSGKGQPLKPYNFRPQRKQVSYVSPQEEEEEEEEERSWSEGSSSEKDWLPEEEEDTEEEEDIEEMEEKEDEEAEREEELEADAGPSVSTSSQFSTDGQVRPSDPLYITSLKEPSHPAWTDGGTSQRNRPLIPVTCPAPHHRKAEPLTPAETPLQLTPTGILLQDVPVISPVTLSPAVAKPVAHTPALPRPPGQATVLPHSQTSVDFPVLTTAPPMSAPLTDSHPEPLTVTIAVGPPEPSGSNPVGGAANNGFILLNPATLPTGTKIILEIPGQKIVPFITAQICAICQAKYVGTHRCRNSPQDPAERSEEEEPRTCQLGAEESTTILWQASPFHPPCPQFHEEREPSIKSHSLYQASSQATYAHGDGEESESDTEEDCEVKGSEEVKLPVANERLSLPVENWQELRQTKQGQSHYVCNLCNKRFVQHYAFENHMHMHSFLRSELLKWQKLHNRKETTA